MYKYYFLYIILIFIFVYFFLYHVYIQLWVKSTKIQTNDNKQSILNLKKKRFDCEPNKRTNQENNENNNI